MVNRGSLAVRFTVALIIKLEYSDRYIGLGRYWEMVERLKINHFYGAPTALRLLIGLERFFILVQIFLVRFLSFRVPCRPKLAYFCA